MTFGSRVLRVGASVAVATAVAVLVSCTGAGGGGVGVAPQAGRDRLWPSNTADTADTNNAADTHRASAPANAKPLRFSAVGDTILGDTPDVPSDPRGYFAPVTRQVRGKANLVFGNLEGTLTTSTASKCGSSNGGQCFAFRNPPGFAKAFAAVGFTVLNNANNHSHDFGDAGLEQTIHAIHSAGMKQTGLPGEITLAHPGGNSVALVAFAPYSNTADLLDLGKAKHLIEKARREAAIVIVYMHAGAEGSDATHVTGHEEYFDGEDRGNPERFAHMAVDAGASLVVASGPHVVRGMQFYRRRLIAYSLGNFANFHNFASGGVLSDSAILHVTLSPAGRFLSGRLLPVTLNSDGQAFPGGDTVSLVRRLSKEDFGSHAARFSRHGKITPPK